MLSLCACGGKAPSYTATGADKQQLEALYEGRQPYQGELHDHANTGGTSDGQSNLDTWKAILKAKDMDFATIVDHKQVLHMRLPEWDNSLFIGGSEAATSITDSKATQKTMHYNMIFSQPEQLEAVLLEFGPYFNYAQDHFRYPNFSTAEMKQLVQSITDNGGFFVHVHPKGDQYIKSDDPLDYYFGDYTGFEVCCAAIITIWLTNAIRKPTRYGRIFWRLASAFMLLPALIVTRSPTLCPSPPSILTRRMPQLF
ncbi:MAG: hypothetical protein IKC95_02350 [Oscillospiraceae bacterium]|nr:hypothetical protein [Oscillospiraceae bacterium]